MTDDAVRCTEGPLSFDISHARPHLSEDDSGTLSYVFWGTNKGYRDQPSLNTFFMLMKKELNMLFIFTASEEAGVLMSHCNRQVFVWPIGRVKVVLCLQTGFGPQGSLGGTVAHAPGVLLSRVWTHQKWVMARFAGVVESRCSRINGVKEWGVFYHSGYHRVNVC